MVPPPRAVKGTTPTAGLRGMVFSRRFDTLFRNGTVRYASAGLDTSGTLRKLPEQECARCRGKA